MNTREDVNKYFPETYDSVSEIIGRLKISSADPTVVLSMSVSMLSAILDELREIRRLLGPQKYVKPGTFDLNDAIISSASAKFDAKQAATDLSDVVQKREYNINGTIIPAVEFIPKQAVTTPLDIVQKKEVVGSSVVEMKSWVSVGVFDKKYEAISVIENKLKERGCHIPIADFINSGVIKRYRRYECYLNESV